MGDTCSKSKLPVSAAPAAKGTSSGGGSGGGGGGGIAKSSRDQVELAQQHFTSPAATTAREAEFTF
eukprot:scaffold367_cov254-Pinguiococcus_pyrenoidosus.AAC.23